MAAMVYSLTLLRFVFITSISIGQGTQIKVGYLVGAGRSDEAHRKVYRYFFTGFIVSLVMVIIVNIVKIPILPIFTKSTAIHQLITVLLLVGLVHEPGRNFNVIIIPALKGAGDIRFPVYMGMIFMWGIGVLFAYVFGISLHWGLLGIGIALASDEWIRGLVIFLRWHKGKWKTKRLVGSGPALPADA
jgi:Na+-driven multidrug efflux pump